jgi:hypothetical protein
MVTCVPGVRLVELAVTSIAEGVEVVVTTVVVPVLLLSTLDGEQPVRKPSNSHRPVKITMYLLCLIKPPVHITSV